MKGFATLVVGIVLGVAAVLLGVYFYFSTGRAPVATSEPPMPFEKQFAHQALDARIGREKPTSVPLKPDEPTLAAGAVVYREHCAVCHGVPGANETFIAKGMYPHPPKLMEGKGVTDDEPGESYWKVANGIRLTGMPGFKSTLSETQLWQVSLLVANADKMSKAVHDSLSAPNGMPTPASAP